MLTRREFAMGVGACVATAIVGTSRLIEFAMGFESGRDESDEDDEEPI